MGATPRVDACGSGTSSHFAAGCDKRESRLPLQDGRRWISGCVSHSCRCASCRGFGPMQAFCRKVECYWAVAGRMAIHTGAAEPLNNDYTASCLNRLARLLAAAHGGQILLTLTSHQLMYDRLPEGISLRDMGTHRLRDLLHPEHVYQVAGAGLPSDFPTLRTIDRFLNNLPLQLTPFIGREREVESACNIMRGSVRLLTLTGPSGTGKTRLGLQVAAELCEEFEDGTFFVGLASVSEPEFVIPSIASALGVREGQGQSPFEALKGYLRDRRSFLVLDTFEHVTVAAPDIAELLTTCHLVKVLVTSRSALHVRGEHEHPVPPLALPERVPFPSLSRLTQYEAVRLFIDRSLAVKPDFVVTSENAPAVAEICHRLDGLPLAIELAAARSRILSPQAMLARLERRLPLLVGGAQDLPIRQQTLRGAIAWSFDLLSREEQRLFAHLAAFSGGCTIESAIDVAGHHLRADEREILVLDGLASLVDKSLLKRRDQVDGEPRFMMLDTIREFGWEHLVVENELEPLLERHASWCVTLGEEIEPLLIGPDQERGLDLLGNEHDNLRSALSRLLASGQPELALRLAGAIWRYWSIRGFFTEGRDWLERSLVSTEDVRPLVRVKAFHGAACLAGDQGDHGRAIAMYEKTLAMHKSLGDMKGVAYTLNNMGIEYRNEGDYVRASALYEEALSLRRTLFDTWGVAASLNNLGAVACDQGDLERAVKLHQESLALTRALGDKRGISRGLYCLGNVAQKRESVHEAAEMYAESLKLRRRLGDKVGIAETLEALTVVSAPYGESTSAARLFGAAEAIREAVQVPCWPVERARYEVAVSNIRSILSESELSAAWAAGRDLPMENAIEAALEIARALVKSGSSPMAASSG